MDMTEFSFKKFASGSVRFPSAVLPAPCASLSLLPIGCRA